MDSNKELNLSKCNVIKVVMMLTIILCHSLAIFSKNGWGAEPPAFNSTVFGLLSDWLGTFHVYTFTFVSGYIFCYSYNEKENYRNFIISVKQRAQRLLIPYYFVTVIWAIPFFVVFFKPSVNQVIHRFVLGESPAQLWFIWMIFIVFIMFLSVVKIMNGFSFIAGFFVSLCVMGGGIIGAKICPNYFQIWTACGYFLFFYLGFSFRKFRFSNIYNIPWFVWLMINLGMFSLNTLCLQNKSNMLFTLISMMTAIIMELAGVLTVVVGISAIKTDKLQKTKLYRYIEKYNFGMYLFHQQIIYISIRYLNGTVPNIIFVILNFISSCVLSAIITWLLSRWKITRMMIGIR